jgi:hypothetical protein
MVSALGRAGPVWVVALAAWSFACSSQSSSATAASQTTGNNNWTLTFHLTGGFAGFDRALDLSSKGAATARDARRQQQITAQVPRDELATIEQLIAQAKSTESQRRDTCRDCIEYSIDIDASGRRTGIRLNDTSLSGSEAAPLVEALRRLLDRLLSGQGRAFGVPAEIPLSASLTTRNGTYKAASSTGSFTHSHSSRVGSSTRRTSY